MSSVLSHFLNVESDEAAKFIRDAESTCGFPSYDTRLLAEVASLTKIKISQLGLDPLDTTSEELYYNLRAKAKKDSQGFAKSLGFRQKSDQIERLTDVFHHALGGKKTFAIKIAVAKKLLQNNPPKQLMRKLGYRTVESMLKREDTRALFSVVFDNESGVWKDKFTKSIKKLKPSDFAETEISFRVLGSKSAKIAKKSISVSYLTGSVVLNPDAKYYISPLFSSLKILDEANKVLHWGFAVQQHQLNQDFAKFVAANVSNEPKGQKTLDRLNVSFGQLSKNIESPLKKLATMNISLDWWKDSAALAEKSGSLPVSFNLLDLLNDQLHGKEFEDRTTRNFSRAFWQKLIERYLSHSNYETKTLQKLNPEPIATGNFEFIDDFHSDNLVRVV